MKQPKQVVVARKLYKIAGTTENEIHKELLIVSRSPIAALKTAESDFHIADVQSLSVERELVWTPRS
jgi:hypothetical protein